MNELVFDHGHYLPSSWVFAKMSEIAKIIRGVSYKKSDSLDMPKKNLTGILRATNIQSKLIFDELVYVPKKYVNDEQYVLENDVIITMSSGSKHLVGKSAQSKSNTNVSFGTFCACLRPSKMLHGGFFGYFFQSELYKKIIYSKSQGVNINNLRREHIENLVVAMPPLNEQKRIVAKIEELFSIIDSILMILDREKSLLVNSQKSILGNAFNGNLTNGWRKNNIKKLKSSETLLGKIHRINDIDSKKASLSSQKLSELPKNWVWVKLNDISTKIVDGAHFKPTYTPNGIPFLSVKDVKNRKVNFDNCKFISEEEHQKLFKRCNPEYGDVLFVKTGATIGRTGVIDTHNEFSLFVSVALVKPNSELINSKYLAYVLEDHVNHMNINLSLKGVAIKNYHLEDMRLIDFPLTDIFEQNEIVRRIEHHFSILLNLDKQINQISKFCKLLKLSILNQAFEGKLVTQDPNDEPAEILLQKIKQEKEQLIQKQKSSKRNGK